MSVKVVPRSGALGWVQPPATSNVYVVHIGFRAVISSSFSIQCVSVEVCIEVEECSRVAHHAVVEPGSVAGAIILNPARSVHSSLPAWRILLPLYAPPNWNSLAWASIVMMTETIASESMLRSFRIVLLPFSSKEQCPQVRAGPRTTVP